MALRRKNFISIFLGLSFVALSVTGIVMYFFAHAELSTTLHLFFGVFFITIAGFHIVNNWQSIKTYAVNKAPAAGKKISTELILASVIILILFAGSFFQLPPFQFIYDWGESFRSSQRVSDEKFSYTVHFTGKDAQGTDLTLDVRKGPYWRWPTFACWVEDSVGNYIQTLYVTEKLAHNNFAIKVIKNEEGEDVFINEPETRGERERPEALPVWAHRLGNKSERGNFVPSGNDRILDGYSGATLTENFLLHARTKTLLPNKVWVKFEVNHSFDWNDYYSANRFPDDPVYSGSGRVGQPSLVYQAMIDLRNPEVYYALKLAGHGHHSGKDGEVYTDVSNITTALEIIDRVIVEVKKQHNKL